MTRLAILGTAAGVLAFVPAFAAGPPPIDNTNATVTCSTITKGVIKPKPVLTTTGGLGATALAISGTLGGCTSSDPAITFPEGKSKFKGVVNSLDNGCGGLNGPSTAIGTITITWGTVPAVTNKTSTVNIPIGGSVGGMAVLAGGPHGTFALGAPAGNPLTVTGGFTGGNGGATSNAEVITQEGVLTILGYCNAKGVKQINIGVGGITLQ